jgi:hypothetical protein
VIPRDHEGHIAGTRASLLLPRRFADYDSPAAAASSIWVRCRVLLHLALRHGLKFRANAIGLTKWRNHNPRTGTEPAETRARVPTARPSSRDLQLLWVYEPLAN